MKTIDFNFLKIINFRKLEEFEINLKSGLVLVNGRNGSGKSSIFNAIYTCLYNRQLNGRPASKAIKTGKKFLELVLGFNINNQEYILSRRIGSKAKVILEKEGEIIAEGNQVKKIIEDLIPSDLMKLSMLQKLDIKSMITNFVSVSEFINKLNTEKKNTEKEILEIQTNIDKIKVEINSLENSLSDINQMINNEKENLSFHESRLKQIQVDQSLEELLSKKNKISEFYNQFNKKCSELEAETRENILKLESEKNEKIGFINYIHTKLNEALQKTELEFNPKINEINSKIQETNINISNIKKDISRYKTLLKNKKCFTCDSDIEDVEKYQNKISNLENQIKSLEKEISVYQQSIEELNKQCNDKKEDYKNRALKKEMEVRNEIQNIEAEILNLNESLKSLEYNKKEIYNTLLQEFNLEPQDLTINYDSLINMINNKTEIETTISNIKNNISNLKSRKSDIEKKINDIKQSGEIEGYELILKTKQKYLNVLETWSNTRLLNKLLAKYVSKTINDILVQKYNSIINVNINIKDNDDLEITVTNMNNEIVDLEDCSTGESVIAKLVLYSSIRDLFSTNTSCKLLVLDEFLDSLDENNAFIAIDFLRKQTERENLSIFVISHREDIQTEQFDVVINMT